MIHTSLKHGFICLLTLLLVGGSALAQVVKKDAGKILPMRRGPELNILIGANRNSPDFYTIRDQSQTIAGKTLAVNFNKEMLLVAVMRSSRAEHPTITISEVREYADRLVVKVKKTTCLLPGIIFINPSVVLRDVAAVPRSDKPIFFIISHVTGDKLTGTETFYPVLHQFNGGDSKVRKPTTRVITDAKTWKALWTDSIGSPPPARTIDFTRQMVVAIFRGKIGKTNAGLNYREDAISDDGKTLTIAYTLWASPRGTERNPSPYLLLVIPASKLPVRFNGNFIAAP